MTRTARIGFAAVLLLGGAMVGPLGDTAIIITTTATIITTTAITATKRSFEAASRGGFLLFWRLDHRTPHV